MKQATFLVPPNYIGRITGTLYAEIFRPKVTLTYEDGHKESAALETIPESYFDLVSAVQSKTRKGG